MVPRDSIIPTALLAGFRSMKGSPSFFFCFPIPYSSALESDLVRGVFFAVSGFLQAVSTIGQFAVYPGISPARPHGSLR